MALIVEMPESLASELLDEDLVGFPLTNKSTGALVQATVEVIGIAANLVTIVVDGATIQEIARRLVAWIRRAEYDKPKDAKRTIRISAPGHSVVEITESSNQLDIEIQVSQALLALDVKSQG